MSDLQNLINRVYTEKVEGGLAKFVRQLSLNAFGQFRELTPVLTGRARAAWTIGVNVSYRGANAEGAVEVVPGKRQGKTRKVRGNVPLPEISKFVTRLQDTQPNDTFFITNNLPYIQRLNEGSSRQAPANFVEGGLLIAERETRKAFKVAQ